ncbi:MAG: 50S ribosomal protein L10 [Chloroflexota bacterium]|nr:50S ribosomal protein L10 [Chloroflexota bacterium]
MAISRIRKEELVAEYTEQLQNSQGTIFAHYKALNVPQMEELRRGAREKEGQVFVVKNTLFQRVIKANSDKVPEGLIDGPMLVGFCHQDAPPLAKVFKTFASNVEGGEFSIKGALVEGHFYTAAETARLAELPSRDEMFSKVLATINAPATQTVGVIASGVRQVLNVLQAYVDKLEEGGAPVENAA